MIVHNLTQTKFSLGIESDRNTLTVNDLSGNGIFRFTTDFAKTVSDVITVRGTASGQFTAEIDKFNLSSSTDKIKLLDIAQEIDFSLTLKEDIVYGNYRYVLEKDGGVYYLKPEEIEQPQPEPAP